MGRHLRLAAAVALAWSLSGCEDQPPLPTGPNTSLLLDQGVYDRDRDALVVYAPARRTSGATGTWLFDGAAWTREDPLGPTRRDGAGMAYDDGRKEVLLFGGATDPDVQLLGDTHRYRAGAWQESPATGPSPRHSMAMAYDRSRRGTWMYGGQGSCVASECQVLWFFDGETWQRFD